LNSNLITQGVISSSSLTDNTLTGLLTNQSSIVGGVLHTNTLTQGLINSSYLSDNTLSGSLTNQSYIIGGFLYNNNISGSLSTIYIPVENFRLISGNSTYTLNIQNLFSNTLAQQL
jgi:hypothetical protein